MEKAGGVYNDFDSFFSELESKPIPYSSKNRPLGLYIAGNPGYGKSSLIQRQALFDIEKGRGVAIIDPTGDLATALIDHIPSHRINDTIYFDTDDPVPIDFFSYRNPAERQVLTDQLIEIFELDEAPISRPRLFSLLSTLFDANEVIDKSSQTAHSPNVRSVSNIKSDIEHTRREIEKAQREYDLNRVAELQNGKLWTLERELATAQPTNQQQSESFKYRCTFLDIQYFLTNKRRRDQILDYVPHRKQEWSEWLDSIKNPRSVFESILERMRYYTEPGPLRTIFESRHPRLNIWDVMQHNKVLIVNLKDTASDLFIGSLICAKFQQAAFGRRAIPEPNRTPYYLYVDECNTILKYAAEHFDAILLRARKYKLCLTLANQVPEDLPKTMREKIGVFGSLVLFNLHEQNARVFKSLIRPYEPEFLEQLGKFEALCRTNNNLYFLDDTPRPLPSADASYAEEIKKLTQKNYGQQEEDEPDVTVYNEVNGARTNRGDGKTTANVEPTPVPPNKRQPPKRSPKSH